MARKTIKTKIEEYDDVQLREQAIQNMDELLKTYRRSLKSDYSVVLASDLIGDGDIEPLPSNHITFDLMTGIGGLPKGKIIEFTGEEGSHKSNFAWECVGSVHSQNDYDFCVWVDAEKAIDLRIPMQRRHLSNMNVDFNRLILIVPDSAEQCWTCIIDACQKRAKLIVLDSVTALVPKKELKAGVEADGYPSLPAAINKGFRAISKELWLSGSTLIEINQVRENLDIVNKKYTAFEDQWKTTGGKGLKHWLTLRLFFRKKKIKIVPDGQTAEQGKVHVGDEVSVSVIKTRLSPVMDKAHLFMYHKSGFDRYEELINYCIEWEILYKSTPRAKTFTFDIDDENGESYTWDEWYSLIITDIDWYNSLCERLSTVYNEYYLSEDSLESEIDEQEYEDDDFDEYDEDEE